MHTLKIIFFDSNFFITFFYVPKDSFFLPQTTSSSLDGKFWNTLLLQYTISAWKNFTQLWFRKTALNKITCDEVKFWLPTCVLTDFIAAAFNSSDYVTFIIHKIYYTEVELPFNNAGQARNVNKNKIRFTDSMCLHVQICRTCAKNCHCHEDNYLYIANYWYYYYWGCHNGVERDWRLNIF